MNIYLKQQLLIHASAAAKEHMKEHGQKLKEHFPKNVSAKNALKIARLRAKRTAQATELREIIEEQTHENEELQKQVHELQNELDYFHRLYGKDKPKPFHSEKKEQLQRVISLQRELIDQQLQAKSQLKAKKISKEEYEELISQYDIHQKALRKKKQKLLLDY